VAHTASTEPPARSPGGEQESPLHESSDIKLRTLIRFAVAFVVVAVLVHIGVWLVFVGFRAAVAQPREITGVSAEHIPPPEPRLEPSVQHNTLPSMDLEKLRAAEHDEFARRGWVDPQTGQVRVPEKIINQLAEMSRGPKK